MNSSEVWGYAMQAMHLGGIVLFQKSEPAGRDEFIKIAQSFGFRFGTLKTMEGAIKLDNDEELSDSTDVPEIEYVRIGKLQPHNIKSECGNVLLFLSSDKGGCR